MSNAPEAPSWREGRSPFGPIGLFLALYLVTRAFSLNALPIFLDEAVHLQWAERLFNEGRILRPVGSGRLLAVAAYGLALAAHGAVSAQVALAMAEGARTRFAADLAAAVTGIAGPGGASPGKPVGLTYVALAEADGATVRRFTWDGDREANKAASATAALELLLERAAARAAVRERG